MKIEEKEGTTNGKLRIYKWKRIKNLDGTISLETETDVMPRPLRRKGKRYSGCRKEQFGCRIQKLRVFLPNDFYFFCEVTPLLKVKG